jgi:hypothetical protein
VSYIVVRADGLLIGHDNNPTDGLIRAEVGYSDRVPLPGQSWPMQGFVPETGHVDGSPRNRVGSVMLMVLGAAPMPYAGTVVITGWEPTAGVVQPLPPAALDFVRQVHGCVRSALDGDPWPSCPLCTDEWRANVRAAAELVDTAPTPTLTIISGVPEGWEVL